MKYYVERYYPLVLGILCGLTFYKYQGLLPNLDDIVKRLLDTTLTISGALLGFLLTILTIINTIETRSMRFVKESGNYGLLNNYLKVALMLDMVSISVYYVLPILLSFSYIITYKSLLNGILIFVISFTWLANIRFSNIFIKLLTDQNQ